MQSNSMKIVGIQNLTEPPLGYRDFHRDRMHEVPFPRIQKNVRYLAEP